MMKEVLESFNYQLNENQLNPFAQSYNQTINVFWKAVDDASMYTAVLYIIDGAEVKYNVLHSSSDVIRSVSVESLVSSHTGLKAGYPIVGESYQTRKLGSTKIIVKKIGIKHLYKLEEVHLDRAICVARFTNLIPNRYCVVVSAENTRGDLVAKARGIEVIVQVFGNNKKLEDESGYQNIITPDRCVTREWKLEDYYEEL